ncbi:substrate-binding periplasmic protein [Vibrio ostreicida]|uniref:substrate-binding periplasmic protein n=1 Tax=Vibrio ostreicida TaxID=526588 RepID=UPI003B5C601D
MKSLLLCSILLFSSLSMAKPQVFMTSLEWPPYSGSELPEQGFSVAVAKAAFAAMGYELVVEFQPWVRAVALATKEDKYIGYFPEYYFETKDFLFSESIGNGPLGLVENTRFPVKWQTLDDLTLLSIGVVQGYINTTEFDEMVKKGELQVEASADDARNIHKVAKGRLDVAVIDSNVLDYLISVDIRAGLLKKRLQMNPRLLEDKELYMAFNNSESGLTWRNIFNQGLKKIQNSQSPVN